MYSLFLFCEQPQNNAAAATVTKAAAGTRRAAAFKLSKSITNSPLENQVWVSLYMEDEFFATRHESV
jgi:hypothetical protein